MDRERIIEECKQKCTCDYRDKHRRASSREDDGYSQDQRTFLSFLTETISVIAFIVFGSVVFWLAVGGILFDFLKRIYYSDRYVKIFMASLFTLLLLSMSVRLFLNKRACRAKYILAQVEHEKKDGKDGHQSHGSTTNSHSVSKSSQSSASLKSAPLCKPPEPPPPPEYIDIKLKDKHLQELSEEHEKVLTKRFTLTIVDEKKKEVFKTTKVFLIPHEAMENNHKPALLFHLKEITIDNY